MLGKHTYGHNKKRWRISANTQTLWNTPIQIDLNLLLGLYLRELHQYCKDTRLVNKGTYGSRANRWALDPVVVNMTKTEISMITKMFLVQFNNDATTCFDRIMPHILNICLQSYQIPSEFTALIGDLLRYAKYAIKTANIVSKETYSRF